MAAPVIVVAIDFSVASRRAMETAARFAQATAARLVLVHAFPPRSGRSLSGAAKATMTRAMQVAELEEATQLTNAWAEKLRAKGVDVEAVAKPGAPHEVVLAEAKRRKARLIATGSTGKGLLKRAFIGSTARRIVDAAEVPVLIVPTRGAALGKRLGPVVAAIDLSPGSEKVAAAGAAVARDLGVPLHAIHCLSVWPYASAGPAAVSHFSPELLERDEREMGQALTTMMEPLRDGLVVENSIEVGEPATAVNIHARLAGASCVVVGRRRTKRKGLGTIAATLMQGADRPLLLVHSTP